MTTVESKFMAIEAKIAAVWETILRTSRLAQAIQSGEFSKELYMIYMLETYHYTSHNARNQAVVGVEHPENPVYMKFCFEHAADEAGHEMMALHDLKSIGRSAEELDIPLPLPATETLIAYLYWVSKSGNPFRRLGYSLWAESSYKYINPLVAKVKERLALSNNQLTFFVAHSDIDDVHAADVKKIIERVCRTEEDWLAVAEVAVTSLRLTGRMLDEVHDEYIALMAKQPSRYSLARDQLFSAESLSPAESTV